MKIGIAGPISTESIAHLLNGDEVNLPRGYSGAPLLGTLINSLLKRGHIVTAFTTSSDLLALDKPVTAEGNQFKIIFCPSRPQAFRYYNGHWGRAIDAFRRERDSLSKAMLEHRPDLIHSHWTYEFSLAALDTGLPHVITCHDAPQVVLRYIPNAYRLVRYFMAKRVFSRARCLTAVSPYLKKMVEGYARVSVTVVPNPLPDTNIGITKRVRQYDPKSLRIAMVLNGWGKLKNPKSALIAFALLRQRIPEVKLKVMGIDFGPGEKAESWAKARGITEGVNFIGSLPYKALLANLAESDLLLHPSLEETFGMSIAEAMALGVPVVGGEESGAVPWVIGEAGITTNVTSPVAIFKAMESVLKNHLLHTQLANCARRVSRARFGSEIVVNSYEAVYAQALKQKNG